MIHMPSFEIWEWGLKIFCGALTLTTHVDHLLFTQCQQTYREANLVCSLLHKKIVELNKLHVAADVQCHVE